MNTYEIQPGDNLSTIALACYGTAEAAEYLARFNDLPDASQLTPGETLRIPNLLIEYASRNKNQKRTNTQSGAEENLTVVDAHCFKVRAKTVFRYADHTEKRTANRRFVYCWRKDDVEGWQNAGIVMTDDWGRPWCIDRYVEDSKSTMVTVPTGRFDEKEADKKVPFGFYLPDQSEEMDFDVSGGALNLAYFPPGETWVFMYAPLDTIQGKDQSYWNNDAFGFDNPAQLKTATQVDVYDLIDRGLAQEVRIPRPGQIRDPWVDEPDSAIVVDLKRNLPEFVSLIKKYTYQLDAALKTEMEVKKPYSEVCGYLNKSNWVLEVMKLAPNRALDVDEQQRITDYQESIGTFREFIEDRYIRGESAYTVDTGYTRHGDAAEDTGIKPVFKPAVLAKLGFLKPSEVADKLIAVIQDPAFVRAGEEYWQRISETKFEDAQQCYFSFKHPTATFLQALQDAFYAVSMLMDEEKVEAFYRESVKPLEEHMILKYDSFDDDDDLKTESLGLVEDLTDMLGENTVESITGELRIPDVEAAKTPFADKSIHQKIWNIVTNPRTTGFWNNQEGAPSMLTRFLKAYARYRNKQIIKNAPSVIRISVRQYKMYMVSVRYMTMQTSDGTLTMTRVRQHYVAITKKQTSVRKAVPENWLTNADGFAKANKYIHSLSCGIQFVAAVAGVGSFLEKDEHTASDHVRLADSLANAGLALTGLSDKQWARIFCHSGTTAKQAGAAKVAVGRYLTGVGFICTCIQSSIATAGHYKYGDEFMTCLSVFKAALSAVGAVPWLCPALIPAAMCGPIGWITFGGILVADAAAWLHKESMPGTENKIDSLMRYLDSLDLFKQSSDFLATSNKVFHVVSMNSIMHSRLSLLQSQAYDASYRFSFPALSKEASVELAALWEDVLIKHNIPFVPLDVRKAMPTLIENGWERQDAGDLCHRGGLASSAVEAVYDEYRNKELYAFPAGVIQQDSWSAEQPVNGE